MCLSKSIVDNDEIQSECQGVVRIQLLERTNNQIDIVARGIPAWEGDANEWMHCHNLSPSFPASSLRRHWESVYSKQTIP